MERAVLRGQAAKESLLPKYLGVDEKAITKGHRYMRLVCDLEEATVQYIGEERKEKSLAAYFAAFPPEERQRVEAISLDMWPAFINACRFAIPDADEKMMFDRFHIMLHVLEAVDRCANEHAARRSGLARIARPTLGDNPLPFGAESLAPAPIRRPQDAGKERHSRYGRAR